MNAVPQVQTVRGPVSVSDLGTTLMHEHVFVLSEEFRQAQPEAWDETQQVADAVLRLRALAATGVATIVDPTVIGLGRNVARVRRSTQQVDLNIVVAAGVYT